MVALLQQIETDTRARRPWPRAGLRVRGWPPGHPLARDASFAGVVASTSPNRCCGRHSAMRKKPA
jgi:hypothetical protein